MATTKPKSEAKGNAEELLKLARERFKRAQEAFTESRQLQRDDQRFALGSPDNNWQWRDEDYKQRAEIDKRPTLTVNKLPLHISQVTNDGRQNRPAIKIRPVDDKADVETAEIYNGVIRHIEANSDADVASDMALDHAATHGEGYIRVLTDYESEESFDQEIFIKPVADPLAIYPDPLAFDPAAATADWWFVEAWYSEEEFKAKWPNAAPANWEAIQPTVQDWFQNKRRRVVEYWHKQNVNTKLHLLGDGTTHIGEITAGMNVVKSRDAVIARIMCCTLSGDAVLEQKEWAGRYFPFVRVIGNYALVDGKIVISGIVRNAKDAQRMYNYWVSQEAEFLGKWTKAPYVTPAEAVEGFEQEWNSANVSNAPYLRYNHTDESGNAIPAPQKVAPPVAPQGLIQAKLGASEDIKATTGQFDASLGQKSNETSGRAILARQREGDTATYHYIDNLSKATRQLGRILVDLIPKIYDAKTIARVLGEDGEAEIVRLDPEMQQAKRVERDEEGKEIARIYNLGVGKYDVVSTVGPSFTTKRQESVEAMTTLLTGMPDLWRVFGDLAVKNMDWPGADDIAKRLKAMIPPEILGADEGGGEQDIPPAVKAQMAQIEQAMQQASQMIEQLQAENAQLKQGTLGKLAEVEKKGDIDYQMKLLDVAKEILLATGQPMPMDVLQQIMQRLDAMAEQLAPQGNAAPLQDVTFPGAEPEPGEDAAHEQGEPGGEMGEGEMPDPSQMVSEDPAQQPGELPPLPGVEYVPDGAPLSDPAVTGEFGEPPEEQPPL